MSNPGYSVTPPTDEDDACNTSARPRKKPIYSAYAQQLAPEASKAAPDTEAARNAPPPEPEAPDAYHITPGWVDASKRTRTWVLRDCHSTQLAQICTKRDAQKWRTCSTTWRTFSPAF